MEAFGRRQEVKIAIREKDLVLCSALKWKVAIVAEWVAPTAKTARAGLL